MPKKPKTRALPSPDRRDRIVQAALQAFIENGIAPTTLRDVAKRARVDPPLIHYYFKTIESLHLAVIALALNDLKNYSLREAEKYKDQPAVWMKEYLKAPLDWIRDRPDLMFLWIYFYTLAAKPGSFRDLNQEIRKGGRERIMLKIYEGIEKGVFKLEPGLSAADAALEIQSWITGAGLVFATETEVGYDRSINSLYRRVFSILGVTSNPQ